MAAKKISTVGLGVLALAVIADIVVFTVVDYGRPSEDFCGCFAYDAMLVGLDCSGFPAAAAVSAWLNWPLWLLYGPLFAVFSIKAAAVALLAWAPLVVYVVARLKVARANA